MEELNNDFKVMLRKLNIYIKEVGGMLVKMKGTFFYIIEIRGSV